MSAPPETPELAVEMFIRNNRLRARRLALGLTRRALAKAANVNEGNYGDLEALRRSPKRQDGSWTAIATGVAQFYRVPEEELFPEIIEKVRQPHVVRELTADQAASFLLSDHQEQLQLPPSDLYDAQELHEKLDAALDDLPERMGQILRAYYGLGGDGTEATLREIGERFDLSTERIRQIIATGLRWLRAPSRGGALAPFARDLRRPRGVCACHKWSIDKCPLTPPWWAKDET